MTWPSNWGVGESWNETGSGLSKSKFYEGEQVVAAWRLNNVWQPGHSRITWYHYQKDVWKGGMYEDSNYWLEVWHHEVAIPGTGGWTVHWCWLHPAPGRWDVTFEFSEIPGLWAASFNVEGNTYEMPDEPPIAPPDTEPTDAPDIVDVPNPPKQTCSSSGTKKAVAEVSGLIGAPDEGQPEDTYTLEKGDQKQGSGFIFMWDTSKLLQPLTEDWPTLVWAT